MKPPLQLLSPLLLVGLLASAQSVRVVDSSGAPGTYLEVSAAVLAASDGDLVLVRPGTYGSFSVEGLSLTLVADGPGVIVTDPSSPFSVVTCRVRDLPAGGFVNLAGLSFEEPNGILGQPVLDVDDCAGPVLVRDCAFAAGIYRSPAARIVDASAVSLVDSELDASLTRLGYVGTDEGHALSTRDSNVFLHGCTLASGSGDEGSPMSAIPLDGGPGPAGWRLEGGTGLAVRSTIQGGRGGNGVFVSVFTCGHGGDGGAGVEFVAGSTDPSLVTSQATLVPGPGGLAGSFSAETPEFVPGSQPHPDSSDCTDGLPGPELALSAGTITTDPFETRALETESLVRVGETKTERFVGTPGDLVWHLFGVNAATPTLVPEITGAIVVGTPFFLRFRGVVPPSGTKLLAVTVPDHGQDFVVLFEQAFFHDGLRFYTSNPQFSVLLDDAF